MLILHGENIVQSRKVLQEQLDSARRLNKDIVRLEAKKLLPSQLEEALGSTNLFGSDTLIVIEELFSLPPSQRKKDLNTLLSKTNTDTEIILWEKRSLTATMIKPFPGAIVQEFKASSYVFTWLDLLGTVDKQKLLQAFHTALQHEDEQFCFIMFIRQIRLLIQAKENVPIAGPPFMITKLKKQAQALQLESLLAIHTKLYQLDIAMKTSKLRNTLASELDLLQLGM